VTGKERGKEKEKEKAKQGVNERKSKEECID
jgi:hypothetical protein